ncbi:MAG: TetR/AcrR family transcriptional regulator [Paludibacterium sp.]|uniref:TetR/AcrR family transcriptional regulator n=1 Tax=Paludibacterium sp. TaxID=1917523 RepID=UPI0025FB9391|nr:TetR/AcrR family transcriptional regulator [Paludibacterium sp.]MBV8047212.1 TetR/AcrR family transcriptional regulator [Paludibacterium sp.]MBV8647110.1 TetR/AcrR family transcriptional regulator [Paludibacterium sp.]
MNTTSSPSQAALPARQRILLTAHALFYRDGIRATGIDRVIAESGVTKVTFYRHFPSKNDLIRAYLEYRHAHWIAWFQDALRRHGAETHGLATLVPVLSEWFNDGGYRGCAFINAVVELGGAQPDILAVAERHKHDMAVAIETLLPQGARRAGVSQAVAMAVDGAIVQVQRDGVADAALVNLRVLIDACREG